MAELNKDPNGGGAAAPSGEPGLPERIFQLAEFGVLRRASELRRVAQLYGPSETADTLQRLRNPSLFKRVVRRLRAG